MAKKNAPAIPKKSAPNPAHVDKFKHITSKKQGTSMTEELNAEASSDIIVETVNDHKQVVLSTYTGLEIEELRQQIRQELLAEFNVMQTQISAQAKANNEESIRLSQLQAEAETGFVQSEQRILSEAKEKVEQLQNQHQQMIEQELSILAGKQQALAKSNAEVLEKTIQLNALQAEAKANFAQTQENIIAQYKNDIEAQQQQLDTLENKYRTELAKQKFDLKKLQNDALVEQQQQLDTLSIQLEKQEQELSKKQAELKSQQDNLEKQQRFLQTRHSSQDQWEKSQQKKIAEDFKHLLQEKEDSLTLQKNAVVQAQQRNNQLQHELHQFADLKRLFNNASAEDIHTQFTELKNKNRELQARFIQDGDEDLHEKNDILTEQLNDKIDELKDLRVEFEALQAESHQNRMSVLQKHQLEQEKRILEQHNQTLDASITQLRQQIDDLIERQQGAETFPALTQLDKDHRTAAPNLQPVGKLTQFAEQLRVGMASVYPNSPLYYREEDVRLFLGGLAMSNLHILQGMSGTGKTSIAKAFTKVVGGYCTTIAVQAGWRDKDDLIGHYNAFEKRFYERETLQGLYRAQLPQYNDRINIILLDEMNLSRPEQYFAEFLSAIEMRPEEREIVLTETSQHNAPTLLHKGRILKVPENVWFIGTANHDETTNEFADKTYDRAHVMELQRNEGTFDTSNYHPANYSFRSLIEAFDNVCQREKKSVEKLLETLATSPLYDVLEERFNVSWGNRFNRHALRFLPVIKHAGGSFSEALDHLLATKVFRNGKATGRYDLQKADLDAVRVALEETWILLEFNDFPKVCYKAIDKDIKRMERGG